MNLTDTPAGPAAVIILAAGQGTRMKSDVPKVLHRLGGLSMIGHALRTARALRPSRIAAVVRHERDLVAAEILRLCPEALIADQDEVPGTGRAVQCGLRALQDRGAALVGTVLVTSGDVPLLGAGTLERLADLHAEGGHAVSLVTTIVPDPTGYGRIVRDVATGSPTAIVEQRDASPAQRSITEVNAGIYAFDAAFLARALPRVGRANDQGEIYLTDVVAAAVEAGRSVGALVLDDPWEAAGCNDRVQLAQLGAELNRRICEGHMRAGVTIVDPSSTWIDVDVTIGRDTTIRPGTCLRGTTEVGPRCEIGPMTTLADVEVEGGSVLPATWGAGGRVPADTMGEPFGVIGRK